MWAVFNRFEIQLTKAQALSAAHPGPCDADVEVLVSLPSIRKQLDKIPAELLRRELQEYGAWSDTELADDEQNRRRVIWLAASDVTELK